MINIEWQQDALILLDQTELPTETVYIRCTDWRQVAEAIKTLRVRGAPAIGIAAGYGLILAARESAARRIAYDEQLKLFYEFGESLKETRPTAINLAWAVNRVISAVKRAAADGTASADDIIRIVTDEAKAIHREDITLNRRMAKAGAALFEGRRNLRILTHCNAGSLATGGIGTALGIVRELYDKGQLALVYADETRPLLQGARLTTFELYQDGIPVTLQTDNMAAYAMQQGLVDAVIVGADRITAKGDVANKIGTYGLAVLADYHNIPFYVAAPYSTFDFDLLEGRDIPIETREADEVRNFHGIRTAPDAVDCLNPAFDVTPHALVSAIVTEEGVLTPEYTTSIENLRRIAAGK